MMIGERRASEIEYGDAKKAVSLIMAIEAKNIPNPTREKKEAGLLYRSIKNGWEMGLASHSLKPKMRKQLKPG